MTRVRRKNLLRMSNCADSVGVEIVDVVVDVVAVTPSETAKVVVDSAR